MDDNKILTLINGERIAMPEQVSLLFEVEDLAVASPATVSRCGMVYNDYSDLGWEPFVTCWLETKQKEKVVSFFFRIFCNYFNCHLRAVTNTSKNICFIDIHICELHNILHQSVTRGSISNLYSPMIIYTLDILSAFK